ncbi:acid protease [Canariomyces notabilis]|uniref:Acid protease n=1 Tax=Canariomyces notabilis TaxID=2074819 RepID=A0AAN6TFL3_9PEZI|nr:acid protease [Canariomyces arenarius]
MLRRNRIVDIESILEEQKKLRAKLGLHKIPATPNPNYKHNGTRSYVSALNRYGFQPTKPGPYFQAFTRDTSRASGKPAPGSLPAVWTGLYKSDKDGNVSKVSADDQQNDAEYLCNLSIGSAPQKLLLNFDTGSADLWVKPSDFQHTKSSTFKIASHKTWEMWYGDGSLVSGFVGTDMVSIGGLVVRKQAVEVAQKLSPTLLHSTMAGSLGMAFRQLNTVKKDGKPDPQRTLLDNMISQRLLPKHSQLFTSALYRLQDGGKQSYYTFGWIDQDLVKESGEDIAWTRVDKSTGFWMFPSESAMVNGQIIPSSGNKAVADTGTALALVSDELCDALYRQIPGALYSYEYQGYIIPRHIKIDQLPNFSLAVGDKQFVIQKQDLLFALADAKYWYGSVQSRGRNPFDILGSTFLKSIYAIWDQGNSRFGAVPKIEEMQDFDAPRTPSP